MSSRTEAGTSTDHGPDLTTCSASVGGDAGSGTLTVAFEFGSDIEQHLGVPLFFVLLE
jgi:hypothetical protein